MYLRTENLLVVTGIYALVNAPTQLVSAPISPFIVTAMLSAVLWIVWPRLIPSAAWRRSRYRSPLDQLVARRGAAPNKSPRV